MKKNILIAFSGMDGSGKTTLAKKLKEYLEKQGYGIYFKHAHGYTISQNSLAVSEKGVRKYSFFFLLLSPYVIFDSWFTYLFKYQKILVGQSLLCDRYFYDKIARLIYYGVCPQSLAKIYLKLLPKPDYCFFLDTDENTAYLRKPEYTRAELSKFRKIYISLADYLKVPVVPTNIGLNDSLRKLIKNLKL